MTIRAIRARCISCGEALRCKSTKHERIAKFGAVTDYTVFNIKHDSSTPALPIFKAVCNKVSCLNAPHVTLLRKELNQ